ncbi:BAH domain TFIIS helical bundle-like domain isoform 4 [Tripterygium wilfordii]|uniref:BAH domain TFIIS helical bundle-like domain isoform 4 n=2 Tax=Tripterygium wilfordii TaxID=458696 RepID=A0A7J7CL11_TRIWF|nr:BAH domain TFIIS helical bundle-like domain isoform 4 [Tripterygium wilfordii]
MHATVQPGGRSPNQINGRTPTSQLKPGSDTIQNSASSFPSQVKGKKRERGDQGSEPVKRDRSIKNDDGDSSNGRADVIFKSEIAKITEKGGLVDSEGVEKFVQLMLPQRNEKKIDLVGRSILASVVAATDKLDCLNKFVQHKGLPVFDEWLQEVHKGKIGDGNSPKDSDKSVEEFLLVLLRALDKLPVNLDALQMCNIGKSVNHLRSHKNMEIQKKARSLVDTWKKRVEVEIDAKSGSNPAVPWSARPRIREISHGANRQSGGTSEVAVKNSVTQLSASKPASVKLVQGDATTTPPASASLESMRTAQSPVYASTDAKDGESRNAAAAGASDILLMAARDEKSSSSGQSHTNSQSCSGDHAKSGGVFGKEDARSSTAGSITVNKITVGSSRNRKSINGFFGTALSGVQREAGSSRSSVNRNPTEKVLQSTLTCEKAFDEPLVENTTQKLIVKIPNRVSSPVQSASGGSVEDPLFMNERATSPLLLEKNYQFDRNLKDKDDANRANGPFNVNNESWQSNDFKDVLTSSNEGDPSPAAVPKEECCRAVDDCKKLTEVSRAVSSPSGNEQKSGKLNDASFSSINALVDSCVNYSKANASVPAGDDVGMNLLARVATEEMSKSEVISASNSPQRNNLSLDNSTTGHVSKLKLSAGDDLAQDGGSLSPDGPCDQEKHWPRFADGKTASLLSHGNSTNDVNGHSNSSDIDWHQTVDPCAENNRKMKETGAMDFITGPYVSSVEKALKVEGSGEAKEESAGLEVIIDHVLDTKLEASSSFLTQGKLDVSGLDFKPVAVEGTSLYQSLEIDGDRKNVAEGLSSIMQTEQKPYSVTTSSEIVKGGDEDLSNPSGSGKDMNNAENCNEDKTEEVEINAGSHVNSCRKQSTAPDENADLLLEHCTGADGGSPFIDNKGVHLSKSVEGNDVSDLHAGCGPAPPKPEAEPCVGSKGSKLNAGGNNEAEECTSASADGSSPSATGRVNADAKVEFDLNEGFNADDAKYGNTNNSISPSCSASIPLISPFPFAVSSVSSGLPSLITVAAAAKGPFVPPEDLLRSKGELGWKGSAATSAFRPAEPRKVLDMRLGLTSVSLPDPTVGRPNRLLLDFDLNVPDERVIEDLACQSSTQDTGSVQGLTNSCNIADELIGSGPSRASGGLDIDLNRVDDAVDMGNSLTSSGHRVEFTLPPVKSSSTDFLKGEGNTRRDFDLNDGPAIDEIGAEPSPFSQRARNTVPSQASAPLLRMNNHHMGNISTWFTPSNTYPAVSIPPILPEREQSFPMIAPVGPQRMMTPTNSSTPFSPDVYGGPVLSSSPAAPFPPTPFQYPVFPFGANFSLPSATFPGGSTAHVDSSSGGRIWFPVVHSQLLGPPGAVPSNYPRPYVVTLADGSHSGGTDSSRKWGGQGLDLNAGPLVPDIEGREDMTAIGARQLSVASSQALVEEQAQFYQVAGGSALKRKEPEGGWEGYRQTPWR